MPKPTVKLRSNFRVAALAGKAAVDDAVDKALTAGLETGRARMSGSRYDLDPDKLNRKDFDSGEGGMVFVHSDNWYYRFLEYGTVHISASPFLRPAHRKMRKVFKDTMDTDFEKFVRAKVSRRMLR